MGLGLPFQGSVVFGLENSYGVNVYSSTVTVPSDKILDAKITVNNTFKALRSISKPSVCGFISTATDYSFHLEWVWQNFGKSLVTYCVNRNSTGDMQNMQFVVGVNLKGATKTYFTIKGAKCKTINWKSSTGNEYIVSADFSCCSVIPTSTVTAGITSKMSYTINGAYAQFNRPGHVIYKDSTAEIATIIDSIDITLNNNMKDLWDADSPYKRNSIPGAIDASGTVNISLDDGGITFLGANSTSLYTALTNIYVSTGLTSYGKITARTARWDGNEVDVNLSSDIVKTGQKFTAKDITITT